MSTTIAILLVVLGGILLGLFSLPVTRTPQWKFEQVWFVGSLFALVLIPWPLVFLTVPDVGALYASVPQGVLVAVILSGAAWGIDCLVNKAFAFTAKGLEATTSDWLRSFTAGPMAFARMVQNVFPAMKASGGGAIVNISSISGHIAQKDRWTYNTSKGAVGQLTKCQALDLAPHNIRVNSVDPGWIWSNETDKAANLDGGGRAKWDPVWGKYHMLRRMGLSIEVARPTLFLLSDDASFITGTTLMVDGGYLSMGPEGLGETAVVAGSD